MSELVVLVPVLGRPHRVAPTLDGFSRTAPGCRVLFIADPDDREELLELVIQDAEFIIWDGSYAAKINAGVKATDEPWIFTGADDLDPQEDWLDGTCHQGAPAGFPIVFGVNDLIPRRRRRAEHATHFLMSRAYAELPAIDGSEGPMFSGYGHEKVDDELIATARRRGAYVYAPDAHVKHLHPDIGTAEWDETYEKGRATRVADRELFHSREHLWQT